MFRIPLDLYLKIFFYLTLIVYHATDVYFDWAVYDELQTDISFVRNEKNTIGSIFLASCIGGTLISILMVVIYGYYITFHYSFLPSRNAVSREPGEINRSIVTMELTVSFCELFYKELIQSSILFITFNSGLESACVSRTTKAFAVCCIFADVKLIVCFYSKLCGIGVGEEIKSVMKALVCTVGCAGALLSLCFTTLYYSDIRRLALCPDI
jgi:hypothetical protein